MDIVYPTQSRAIVTLPSGAQILVIGGTHWSTDDEVVRTRPDLFSADPRYGLAYSTPPAEMAEPPVEDATAVPGERRNVRRRVA